MKNNVIEINKLTKEYKMFDRKIDRLLEIFFPKIQKHKTFSALNDVDLQIKEGEVLGILGKNGAGKSTLLKIITGVVSPTSGDVKITGKVSSLLELGTAFNPELTGIENIYQHGQVMGLTNNEIKLKMQEIIDFADIGDHLYQPVKTYSSGMFARLAFACAINVNPDILIVDEVLSVGDMAFQLKCFKKFEKFKEDGKTIIFVSHNINDILKNCTRAVILESGKKVFDGSTKDAVNLYKKKISNIDDNSAKTKKIEILKENRKKIYKDLIEVNQGMDRYGNNKIEIVDFCLFNEHNNATNTINIDNNSTIYIRIKSNIDVDNIMLSFSIKDFNGIEYCGVTENIETIKKGEELEVTYTQKIPLKPERYTLSFGCGKISDDGNIEIFDRLYDAVLFQIVSDEGVLGIFKLDTTINKNII